MRRQRLFWRFIDDASVLTPCIADRSTRKSANRCLPGSDEPTKSTSSALSPKSIISNRRSTSSELFCGWSEHIDPGGYAFLSISASSPLSTLTGHDLHPPQIRAQFLSHLATSPSWSLFRSSSIEPKSSHPLSSFVYPDRLAHNPDFHVVQAD